MGLIESCSKICSKNEGPQTFPNAKQTNLSPPENFIEVDSNEQSQNASISEIIPSRESKILIMKQEKKQDKKSGYFLKYNNPFNTYNEICDIGIDLKKVSLIKNPETFRIMRILSKSVIKNNFLLLKQLNVLKELDHPNISKIYECYDYDNKMHLISEYSGGDSLYNYLKEYGPLSEEKIKIIMFQLLNAISYLHSNGIIYDNIILKNIFLNKIGVKENSIILPFAQSLLQSPKKNKQKEINNYEITILNSNSSVNNLLKKDYLEFKEDELNKSIMFSSPEKIKKVSTNLIDEWACGVLIYILMSGEAPFRGKSTSDIEANIQSGKIFISSNIEKNYSEKSIDLLQKLLNVNPEKRIQADEALRHKFFAEFASQKVSDVNLLKKLMKIEKPASKFHECVIAYLCLNFINKSEEKKLLNLFRIIDRENKNTLNKKDLENIFKENNVDYNEDVINHIIDILDNDKNDKIEYQEFLRAMCNKENLYSDNNLRSTFAFIDNENKGFINAEDISKFIFKDNKMHSNEVEEYIKSFGMSMNDKMNLEQFCYAIKNKRYK